VHDSPGFEVRDDFFDDVADFVDLFVEVFFPVQQVSIQVGTLIFGVSGVMSGCEM
jgi:hypothetical protein